MESKRFFLFVTLSIAVLLGHVAVTRWLYPLPDKPQVAEKDDGGDAAGEDPDKAEPAKKDGETKGKEQEKKKEKEAEVGPKVAKKADDEDGAEPPPRIKPVESEPAQEFALQRVVLGSLDPDGSNRMAVTLINRGAAVERIELNNERYTDIEDTAGYLGHLAPSDATGGGCLVNVVVPGSPAANAGLQVGDVITAVDEQPINTAIDLVMALRQTEPKQEVKLSGDRTSDGAKKTFELTATLWRRPLEVVRPELGNQALDVIPPGQHDQLSFLMTLERIRDQKLAQDKAELDGVPLRESNWEITKQSATEVEFKRSIPALEVDVVKRFRLAEVPEDERSNNDYPAYHLGMDIEILNTSSEETEISYRLDGPTGLPAEGWWYARKIGRSWRGLRLRDVSLHTESRGAQLFDSSAVVQESEEGRERKGLLMPGVPTNRLAYIGVDAIYFAAVIIPQNDLNEQWFSAWEGVMVGNVPTNKKMRHLTNLTSRVISVPQTLPAKQTLKHSFVVFAGPKRPSLLEEYGPEEFPTPVNLRELIYYGWPIWAAFARPLAWTLHTFYAVVGNYGIAIIMLTVLVRLCMFPVSRKQAINAQKMQELQPEMKRITEKYKSEPDKRIKAMQELYRKHNHNPLAGCLPLFVQLPIFIGLYRSLMVDVELRQAPLISESIRWCSNLAAPDMFLRWDGWMPAFLASETGWLGPYLNILPLFTVVLFIWQQKMFMPPAADEQAAMQQKIMQYMMVFFGFLFFTVPSGLCLYFIVSSLWGLGERKLLPKAKPAASSKPIAAKGDQASGSSKASPQSENGSGGSKGKKRRKQKR